jgi:CheY-like chemotaxis protein
MRDYPNSEATVVGRDRDLRAARLVGFSARDRELLQLFLRRPPRSGVSLAVVDNDAEADLLIVNLATDDSSAALQGWGTVRPAIGIVERFERDASYYQIAQDGQMLFSLAQAINRIRSGWTPPVAVSVEPQLTLEQREIDADVSPDAFTQTVDAVDAAFASSRSDAPINLSNTENRSAPASTAQISPQASPSRAAGVTTGLAVAAGPAGNAAAKGLPWQRALDILVIDDSHFSRAAITEALVKVGFSVNMAESGAEGIKLAAEKRFDVALVDFEMPGMQGPEVLRKLRALGASAPTLLIMLTSRTGPVDRLRAKFAGCDAYLTKPTRMTEFLKILKEFAAAGKLTRS